MRYGLCHNVEGLDADPARYGRRDMEKERRMPRDENISADTSGRSTDIGGSTSGGKAGDDPVDALRHQDPDVKTSVSADDADKGEQLHGTPHDLKPGKRRTIDMDEDDGAGTGVPGETASD